MQYRKKEQFEYYIFKFSVFLVAVISELLPKLEYLRLFSTQSMK